MLISSNVITSVTYLKSWALVTPIIASRFLLDLYSFLLKVIGVSSLRPFPFQAHLKSTRKLLPPGAITCVPPFEQLVERNTNHFQDNISKILHDHSFINILFYLPSNLYQTCLRSCAGGWLHTTMHHYGSHNDSFSWI